MPDTSLIAVWNSLLKQLDGFFEKAIETAESDPYAKYEYVKGYKAGLETARKLAKSLEAEEPKEPAPEEIH